LGEVYLDEGSTLTLETPVSIIPPAQFFIHAFSEGQSAVMSFNIAEGGSVIVPPEVTVPMDTSVLREDTISLRVAVDGDSAKPYEYEWECLTQNAVFSDTNSATTSVWFGEGDYRALIRCTVRDGIHERCDDMVVNLFDAPGFLLLSPNRGTVGVSGEHLLIRWYVASLDDAMVSLSYDNGLNWEENVCAGRSVDSTWGTFSLPIPADARHTDQARVRISTYKGRGMDISPKFTIGMNK